MRLIALTLWTTSRFSTGIPIHIYIYTQSTLYRYEPYPHGEHRAMIYILFSYDTYAHDECRIKIAALTILTSGNKCLKILQMLRYFQEREKTKTKQNKKRNKPQSYISLLGVLGICVGSSTTCWVTNRVLVRIRLG